MDRKRVYRPIASTLPFLDSSHFTCSKKGRSLSCKLLNSLIKQFDSLDWWKSDTSVLPMWSVIAEKIILLLAIFCHCLDSSKRHVYVII